MYDIRGRNDGEPVRFMSEDEDGRRREGDLGVGGRVERASVREGERDGEGDGEGRRGGGIDLWG